eukprot:GHUV01025016.1.p1 GENE.GHUV01025016.1~~GHUV01025016.1.p1  ORF type:complete len:103 (+),score=18.66 GHUV01025016.1:111-419(+)
MWVRSLHGTAGHEARLRWINDLLSLLSTSLTVPPISLPLPCVHCTAASYNALLDICYRTNDSDRALDVLDRMADDEVEPDETTYEIVARKRAWRSYMRKVFG